MLKISIYGGMYKLFTVEGKLNDDILSVIDEYVQENKEEFITYDFEEIEGEDENYIPINGGEYYIDNIYSIEEVN
jgi:hypothetical protein